MIDMNHKYQTRDGRAVRILAMDFRNYGETSIVGIVSDDKTDHLVSWDLCGNSNNSACFDLVPVPTKHEGWCAVCLNPLWTGHTNIRTEKKTAIDDMRTEAWGDLKKDWTIAHVTWEG